MPKLVSNKEKMNKQYNSVNCIELELKDESKKTRAKLSNMGSASTSPMEISETPIITTKGNSATSFKKKPTKNNASSLQTNNTISYNGNCYIDRCMCTVCSII
eukprot:TRINITY_DN7520_c0_g1_i18.p1 TRINITY_DN7520_c0_g1~~TRINITY_DN7520_c0_g1_i18.p1  ORF type:complete len:103 (+),score=12.57 TRINITY_DN7520_c0_g1_i18:307-615(+)